MLEHEKKPPPKPPQRSNSINVTLKDLNDYAQLADNCYPTREGVKKCPDEYSVIGTSKKLVKMREIDLTLCEDTTDVPRPEYLEILQSGFAATAYVHKKTGNIYIAMAGTDKGSYPKRIVQNYADDVLILFQTTPKSFQWAESYVKQVMIKASEIYPDKVPTITLIGHSKAGVDCQLLAVKYGIPCITFDSPGAMEMLRPELQEEMKKKPPLHILNIIGPINLINNINTRIGQTVSLDKDNWVSMHCTWLERVLRYHTIYYFIRALSIPDNISSQDRKKIENFGRSVNPPQKFYEERHDLASIIRKILPLNTNLSKATLIYLNIDVHNANNNSDMLLRVSREKSSDPLVPVRVTPKSTTHQDSFKARKLNDQTQNDSSTIAVSLTEKEMPAPSMALSKIVSSRVSTGPEFTLVPTYLNTPSPRDNQSQDSNGFSVKLSTTVNVGTIPLSTDNPKLGLPMLAGGVLLEPLWDRIRYARMDKSQKAKYLIDGGNRLLRAEQKRNSSNLTWHERLSSLDECWCEIRAKGLGLLNDGLQKRIKHYNDDLSVILVSRATYYAASSHNLLVTNPTEESQALELFNIECTRCLSAGYDALNRGNHSLAVKYADKLISLFQESPDGYILRAKAYLPILGYNGISTDLNKAEQRIDKYCSESASISFQQKKIEIFEKLTKITILKPLLKVQQELQSLYNRWLARHPDDKAIYDKMRILEKQITRRQANVKSTAKSTANNPANAQPVKQPVVSVSVATSQPERIKTSTVKYAQSTNSRGNNPLSRSRQQNINLLLKGRLWYFIRYSIEAYNQKLYTMLRETAERNRAKVANCENILKNYIKSPANNTCSTLNPCLQTSHTQRQDTDVRRYDRLGTLEKLYLYYLLQNKNILAVKQNTEHGKAIVFSIERQQEALSKSNSQQGSTTAAIIIGLGESFLGIGMTIVLWYYNKQELEERSLMHVSIPISYLTELHQISHDGYKHNRIERRSCSMVELEREPNKCLANEVRRTTEEVDDSQSRPDCKKSLDKYDIFQLEPMLGIGFTRTTEEVDDSQSRPDCKKSLDKYDIFQLEPMLAIRANRNTLERTAKISHKTDSVAPPNKYNVRKCAPIMFLSPDSSERENDKNKVLASKAQSLFI